MYKVGQKCRCRLQKWAIHHHDDTTAWCAPLGVMEAVSTHTVRQR